MAATLTLTLASSASWALSSVDQTYAAEGGVPAPSALEATQEGAAAFDPSEPLAVAPALAPHAALTRAFVSSEDVDEVPEPEASLDPSELWGPWPEGGEPAGEEGDEDFLGPLPVTGEDQQPEGEDADADEADQAPDVGGDEADAEGALEADGEAAQGADADADALALQSLAEECLHVSRVSSLLDQALSLEGSPYSYGATGPTAFDCSGFVQYCFRNALGVELPRVASAQAALGESVPMDALEPGDLLYWGSGGGVYHVGLYVGEGSYIHAGTGATGVCVAPLSTYTPSGAKRLL